MASVREIELLAPAKNLSCGLEAIAHGADAVYIGAPKFGARAAAGNSLKDIAALVQAAHLFRARVYVTVNTLLKEEELQEAEQLVWNLYRVGVDALIVQDMALLQLNLPPIPLHASTQMDNRTLDQVRFLQQVGFSQVVLARELSLKDIARIHEGCEVPLEAFVHGALCVSFSGQCYASQCYLGRSANRGECAQFCRLAFDLEDADGQTILRNRHLLSLKDMNRSDSLELMLDAGITSLKIEGRLKEVSYVKNITALYRQKLDAVFRRRPEYRRSSSGRTTYTFTPQADKSFSRGFTDYLLNGRTADIFSFDTPKSMGEEMGRVKEAYGNCLTVSGLKPFHNGDGACFVDEKGVLQGFRVNRVEGNRLYLQEKVTISPHTLLFRNYDQEFEKQLSKTSAVRKLAVDLCLYDYPQGFALTMADEDGVTATLSFPREKELAHTPQEDNLRLQLGKLGTSLFEVRNILLRLSAQWFLPSSAVAEMRRQTLDALNRARKINFPVRLARLPENKTPYFTTHLTYLGNVANSLSRAFYAQHGVNSIDPAFELQEPADATLMFCKHCLRYSMGWCPVHQKGHSPYREPYALVTTDGKRFPLSFDCRNCVMKVQKPVGHR